MSQIILHYSKPYKITIEEAQERTAELTTTLKSSEFYYRRYLPGKQSSMKSLSDCVIENEIQNEIDYYESEIFNAEKEKEKDLSILNTNDLRINSLEIDISALQHTVYQLIGGLFNKKIQKNTKTYYEDVLYSRDSLLIEDHTGSLWPTTRQGHENEEQIKLMKLQIAKLEDKINILTQKMKRRRPLYRLYGKFKK